MMGYRKSAELVDDDGPALSSPHYSSRLAVAKRKQIPSGGTPTGPFSNCPPVYIYIYLSIYQCVRARQRVIHPEHRGSTEHAHQLATVNRPS